jgi:hypothetical protein
MELILRWSAVAGLLALAACGTPGGTLPPGGAPGEDVVRLTSGETVRGRIVEEDARRVLVERDDRVLALPRGAVYSVDYSRESFARARTPELRAAGPASGPARPASSWIPRSSPSEAVAPSEVLWFDAHPEEDCVGARLGKTLRELPDFRLYVEPGGRLELHDPRRWGYHAHLSPSGFQRPLDKPGLSLAMPAAEAALPESATFVSPAQELKAGERMSFTPPDALRVELRPVSEADASLAGQPFSGARPSTTRNGSLWAFGLPRNPKQFVVWLLDPARKHGEILKASFAGYGSAVLAPDLILDSVGADGVVLGRALVVPYPDGVPADGPAAEAVTVYSGPVQDPTEVVRLPLPPRTAIVAPPSAPSTRATVLVSHFDVSPRLPQAAVSAWGLGRLSGEVQLELRTLTAKEADQVVKVDLGSLPEDRFPAVAWLHVRRTYAWRSTGGRLLPAEPLLLPPPGARPKLGNVKRNDAVPHVVPLYFQGPKPAAGGSAAGETAVRVAGGMSEALLADALLRERGGSAPAAAPGGDGGSGSYSNVTNLTVVVPPHDPAGGLMSAGPASPPGGTYLSSTPGWGGPAPVVNPISGQVLGSGVYGPLRGVERGGVYLDTAGNVLYDPATGEVLGRPAR